MTERQTLRVGDTVILNDFMDKSAGWDEHVAFKCEIIWAVEEQDDAVGKVTKRMNDNAPKRGAEVMLLDEWVFESKKCRITERKKNEQIAE